MINTSQNIGSLQFEALVDEALRRTQKVEEALERIAISNKKTNEVLSNATATDSSAAPE